MTELGQLIDHAAQLQQQVDRLWAEMLVLYLTLFAVAVLLAILSVRVWRS